MYTINPDGGEAFDVYCDMTNGGWTFFQRRLDNSVYFYRGWADYKAGFGDLTGKYLKILFSLFFCFFSTYQLHLLCTKFNIHALRMANIFKAA